MTGMWGPRLKTKTMINVQQSKEGCNEKRSADLGLLNAEARATSKWEVGGLYIRVTLNLDPGNDNG
jgi:hypothetical protein